MEISGWGRYPVVDARVLAPRTGDEVLREIAAAPGTGLIARGLGRSYGDSALAARVIDTRYLDHFRDFDPVSGRLTCGAGLSLAEIIDCLLPRGWFPVVVPGTKFVTVGGAVASDVHGKNHHRDGCFSDHVESLLLATVSDGIVDCSREHLPGLFRATCGGMGLTGVILAVTLRLRRVASAFVDETLLRAKNVVEAVELFQQHEQAGYSVAWIDCSATGNSLGRSVISLGEHSAVGGLECPLPRRFSIPCDLPGGLLNRHSIRAFNQLYYHRAGTREGRRRVHLDPWFFPLDSIHNWNRIYGRQGFLQYQCALPKAAGVAGLERILKRISESSLGSFLAVLKSFGPGNANYLSFPLGGWTLALDFRRSAELQALLLQLDAMVLDHGGRIYLTKDARMPREVFRRAYPDWEQFVRVRHAYGAHRVFHSLQSTRLGL